MQAHVTSRSYVLEQHLHRDEVIRPGARKLGVFKATDSVFRRSDVVQLKSTENFWREGRVVKDDEIPMKWVKSRTVTINRKRAEEFALQEGNEPTQQALYSEAQTEIYVPPPVGPDVSRCLTPRELVADSIAHRARSLGTTSAILTFTSLRCSPLEQFTLLVSS